MKATTFNFEISNTSGYGPRIGGAVEKDQAVLGCTFTQVKITLHLLKGSGLTMMATWGIGCTPSPWFGSKALEFGFYGSISADSVGSKFGTNIAQNAYASSEGAEPSPWKYITSSTNARPSLYQQYDGGHYFSTAATGTAGTAISWSESMRLDASGNVGIGTSAESCCIYFMFGKSGGTGSGTMTSRWQYY